MKWEYKEVNRILKYGMGLMFMGCGTVLMLKSDLGVAAFDALCMGMSRIVNFSAGKCCMALGILIIFFNAALEKKIPNIFSFLTSLIVGMCIDFWMKMIGYNPNERVCQFFFLIIGILINTFGIALYISAGLSKGPIDQLMLNISNLLGISIRLGKTYIEIIFLIIALGLKGPIGIGTIVITFVSGALIQKFLYIIKERKEKRDGYVTSIVVQENKNKNVVVLFSGGIDCSLVSLLLRKEGYRVHLLHYDHGASISNGLHRIRFQELKNLMGEENVLLQELSHRGLFRKLALANIENDFAQYKTNMICLGCRLAMHIETITYCLKNDIHIVADGSVKYQNDFPEQNGVALEIFRGLYEKYGIEYKTLLSEVNSAKDVKYRLLDNGISIQSMEDTCLFSNTFNKAEEKSIEEFLNARLPVCDTYIEEKLCLMK